MVIFHSYVSLPEGMCHDQKMVGGLFDTTVTEESQDVKVGENHMVNQLYMEIFLVLSWIWMNCNDLTSRPHWKHGW